MTLHGINDYAKLAGRPQIRAPQPIRETVCLPSAGRPPIDTLDIRVGDLDCSLDCYGTWQKGEPETALEPSEPDGWELTRLDLHIGDEVIDVTDTALNQWAVKRLGRPEDYA
jgi:hypothetical protein